MTSFSIVVSNLSAQSHASYERCGLGSDGTDRVVALVRDEARAAAARGEAPPLHGAKITGGGSGGAPATLSCCCGSALEARSAICSAMALLLKHRVLSAVLSTESRHVSRLCRVLQAEACLGCAV